MTCKEAIKDIFENGINLRESGYVDIESLKVAVSVLGKQILKKPDYEGDGYDEDGYLIYDTWICPNCGEHYEVDYDEYDFCPKCGQALDWSDSK